MNGAASVCERLSLQRIGAFDYSVNPVKGGDNFTVIRPSHDCKIPELILGDKYELFNHGCAIRRAILSLHEL